MKLIIFGLFTFRTEFGNNPWLDKILKRILGKISYCTGLRPIQIDQPVKHVGICLLIDLQAAVTQSENVPSSYQNFGQILALKRKNEELIYICI